MTKEEVERYESSDAFHYIQESAKTVGIKIDGFFDCDFGTIVWIMQKLGAPTEFCFDEKKYENSFLFGMSPINHARLKYIRDLAIMLGVEYEDNKTRFDLEFIANIMKRLREGTK